MARLLIKEFGSPELGVVNIDLKPAPAIMAGGLGAVARGQYWVDQAPGLSLPAGLSPKESWTERDCPEAFRFNEIAREAFMRLLIRPTDPRWFSATDLNVNPSPTITANGIGGSGKSGNDYWIEETGMRTYKPNPAKPAYQVMSMDEIRALEPNGFKAISTFSGCGGSSLGYRMAGFQVLWASEFIDAARDTYKANCAPYTIVDGRDIRQVRPEEILDLIKLKPGELDLMDGSPPCSSFSTAGKREKGWGRVKKYSDKAQRTDDLFFEFTRLLRVIQPKTFVAENVAGLVKGTAKGYFIEILKELKACGYDVSIKVLDAQWLGVPQSRQRTIFVGVRSDLNIKPVHPKPLPYNYSVRDAIPWIKTQGDNGGFGGGKMRPATVPSPTIGASPQTGNGKFPPSVVEAGQPGLQGISAPYERRKFSIAELKRICGFPDDFALTGSYSQQWERLGRAVPPVMMKAVAETVRDQILRRI